MSVLCAGGGRMPAWDDYTGMELDAEKVQEARAIELNLPTRITAYTQCLAECSTIRTRICPGQRGDGL